MNIFLWVVGAIFAAIAIAFLLLLVIPSDSWDSYFHKFPNDINTNQGCYPYKRTIMKFEKWKQLFELDPDRFDFIRISGPSGIRINLRSMEYPIRKTHPIFYSKDEEVFYLIDFRYLEYVKYYYYERRIRDRISFLSEEKMTKAIVGDVQSKIDALVEESEKHIKNTLKLQEKIVLRMSGENKEESV